MDQELRSAVEELRRQLETSAAETRRHTEATAAENRRHFDVVAEALRRDGRLVAEGVTGRHSASTAWKRTSVRRSCARTGSNASPNSASGTSNSRVGSIGWRRPADVPERRLPAASFRRAPRQVAVLSAIGHAREDAPTINDWYVAARGGRIEALWPISARDAVL